MLRGCRCTPRSFLDSILRISTSIGGRSWWRDSEVQVQSKCRQHVWRASVETTVRSVRQAGAHSITKSTEATIGGGPTKPDCAAVLRFNARVYAEECSEAILRLLWLAEPSTQLRFCVSCSNSY